MLRKIVHTPGGKQQLLPPLLAIFAIPMPSVIDGDFPRPRTHPTWQRPGQGVVEPSLQHQQRLGQAVFQGRHDSLIGRPMG
jgi:hypothetical protein